MSRILFAITIVSLTLSVSNAQDVLLRDTLPSRRAKLESIEGKQVPPELWPSQWNHQQSVTLESLVGHPTLVVLYADWLPESKQALEIAKTLKKEFEKGELQVLGIHGGVLQESKIAPTDSDIRLGFDRENRLRGYLLADADPNYYVFDRSGQLAYADVSTVDLRTALMAAINTNKVAAEVPPEEMLAQEALNGPEAWGFFDIDSWQQMIVALPNGDETSIDEAIFMAPPVKRSGKFERHQLTSFSITDHQVKLRAKHLGQFYSDRIVHAFIDREQGLGVGRIAETSTSNGSTSSRDSFVVLQRVPENLPLDKKLPEWSGRASLGDFRVRGVGDQSRLPKSFSWLFELQHNMNSNHKQVSSDLPYDRVLWPPVNDFTQNKAWQGVNDMQGRAPLITLPNAQGYNGSEPTPFFVPGKVTVLFACSSPNAKLWQGSLMRSRQRQAGHLDVLLNKYSEFIHVVSYLGGKEAISNVDSIVPETFRNTVILDPDSQFLKMQNLQDKGSSYFYVFSTDQRLRWMGTNKGDGTATTAGNFSLLSVLLVDPAIQYQRYGKVLDETLRQQVSKSGELAQGGKPVFDELLHPFTDLFRPTQRLEFKGENAIETHRVLFTTEDLTGTEFKGRLRVVSVKLGAKHPLFGNLGYQSTGYEQKVNGAFDPSSNTVTINLGEYITEPAFKQLALSQTIQLKLDPNSMVFAGGSGNVRLVAQPFSMPRTLSQYKYDGRNWSKTP